MIPREVHLLVVGILSGDTRQLFLGQTEVLEFVLEDNARVVESVHDDEVALLHLLLSEGNHGEVVLTVMRVGSQRVLFGLSQGETVVEFRACHTQGV